MPNFSYIAINEQGKEITGVIEAADAAAAQRNLQSQNLLPTKVKQAGTGALVSERKGRALPEAKEGKRRKITAHEIIDFTRQIATLLRAGVPILASLETLSGQAENPNLGEVLIRVSEDIASGEDFSIALSKHPKVFSGLYVASVRAGEASGALDEVLLRIADLLKRDADIKARVKSALRYPTIVIIAMCVAFLVIVTVVVPKFSHIFDKIGLDLPLPTKILIFIADAIFGYWWLIIIVGFVVVFGFRKLIKTKAGRLWWDGTLLNMPLFGPLILKSAMTRFTRMFETLSRSGLPILQIFEIVSQTMGNEVLARALKKAGEGIEHGRGIAVSLADTGLFPPLVVKMISVGEASGAIDEMLTNISDYYEEEVSRAVDGLTAMIEPILTVGMGGMVLVLMLAIFLPMWDMTKMAQQGP